MTNMSPLLAGFLQAHRVNITHGAPMVPVRRNGTLHAVPFTPDVLPEYARTAADAFEGVADTAHLQEINTAGHRVEAWPVPQLRRVYLECPMRGPLGTGVMSQTLRWHPDGLASEVLTAFWYPHVDVLHAAGALGFAFCGDRTDWLMRLTAAWCAQLPDAHPWWRIHVPGPSNLLDTLTENVDRQATYQEVHVSLQHGFAACGGFMSRSERTTLSDGSEWRSHTSGAVVACRSDFLLSNTAERRFLPANCNTLELSFSYIAGADYRVPALAQFHPVADE